MYAIYAYIGVGWGGFGVDVGIIPVPWSVWVMAPGDVMAPRSDDASTSNGRKRSST